VRFLICSATAPAFPPADVKSRTSKSGPDLFLSLNSSSSIFLNTLNKSDPFYFGAPIGHSGAGKKNML